MPVSLVPSILLTNKCLYCAGSCPGENSEDPPRGNSSCNTEEAVPEEQPQTELIKQEMLVQYLQDAYNFSVKITEAMSMISKMMYENCVSGLWNSHGALPPLFRVSRSFPLLEGGRGSGGAPREILDERLFTERMSWALPAYRKSKHHLNGCSEGVVLGHERAL